MSSENNKSKPIITENDLSLWQKIAQDIKPLPVKQRNNAIVHKQINKGQFPGKFMEHHIIKIDAPYQYQINTKIDPKKRRALLRGKIEIEASLDLHGLNQDQAHARLKAFINYCYYHQKRFVTIITGKGKSADGYGGILKRIVPQWLKSYDLAPYIIGFENAHVSHGGSGALYVWIRKRRGIDI